MRYSVYLDRKTTWKTWEMLASLISMKSMKLSNGNKKISQFYPNLFLKRMLLQQF